MDLGYTCHIFYADDVYQRKLWLESLTLASEYSIERFLDVGSTVGTGCCSDVHIAKDRQSGSLVAVKSISKDEHSDKRIKREVSIMRKMHSRHVLGTLGTFDSVKHFHIVMPYMSGGSLLDKMIEKRNIFNEADVRDLMRQVLSGLAYIHAKNVVHRDLKPDNILLHGKAPYQVRIADFGMSIFHNPLDAPMRNVVGNPLFMAPEIWKRSGYGKEVDLWSLGVIMYTMLSGKYPLYLRQILNRVYKSWNITYNDVEWGHISDEAKSLNRMLLCPDSSRRVSAAGALEHKWFSNAVIDVDGVSLPDVAGVGKAYSNARVINMDACAIRQRIRTNLRTFRVCVHAIRFLHRMAVKHERGGSKTKKAVVPQSNENANVEPRMSEVKREMQTMLNAFLIGQSKMQKECIENVVCRWSGAYRTT